MKQITLRLSPTQLAQLDKLSERLQVDRANVMRLAITCLAEREGIIPPSRA